MPRSGRAAAGPALRECPVFFGSWPEAAGFVLLHRDADSPAPSGRDVRGFLSGLIRLAGLRGDGAAWWLALGRPLLGAPAPRHLRKMALHGDEGSVPDHTDSLYAALFVSGPAGLVPPLLSALGGQAPPEGLRVSVHAGSLSPKGIGNGGFVDPVSNLQELAPAEFDQCVFVGSEDPCYRGWSYLVLRDYHEDIEMWHDLPCSVQEQIVGRDKASGALLGGGLLWRSGGREDVSERAHVACVRPGRWRSRFQWRDRLYRRSLAYVEADGRQLSYGLYFISLCRNPVAQFKRIHDRYVFRGGQRYDRLISSGYVAPRSTAVLMLPPRQDLEGLAIEC